MSRLRFSTILACAAALALTTAPLAANAAPGVTMDVRADAIGSYKSANGLGTPTFDLNLTGLVRLSPGVGAGQADKLFSDKRTLAASATENLDLAGTLVDPLGTVLNFAKVKAILIIADPSNTNNVVIGGAATNAFVGPFGTATDTIAVKPGGVQLIAVPGSGWTVTAATADLLKVANSGSGSAVTYKVVIVGTSS